MQIDVHYDQDTAEFLRPVARAGRLGKASGISAMVGPSTRGGRPVNFDPEKPAVEVLIDPDYEMNTQVKLDLSRVSNDRVSRAVEIVEREGKSNTNPADYAVAVVTALAGLPVESDEVPQAEDYPRLEFAENQPGDDAQSFFEPTVAEVTDLLGTRAPRRTPAPVQFFDDKPIPLELKEAAVTGNKPSPAPAPAPAPAPTPAPVTALQPALLPPSVMVTFQRPNGDAIDSAYHDVVLKGEHLTLAYNHNYPAAMLFRPGASEDPLVVSVTQRGQRTRAFVCFATGYRLRHREWEYLAFVVQSETEVE